MGNKEKTTEGYRSSEASRAASRDSWVRARARKSASRMERAVVDANAKAICADPAIREEMRKMIRARINARARDIRAGNIVITKEDIRRIRSEAAKKPRAVNGERLKSLRKVRSFSKTFSGTFKSFGLNDSDLVSEAKSDIAIPKTKSAIARLVKKVESDSELFAAVSREMARLARLDNVGLTREQIMEKAKERGRKAKRTYTMTDLVRARLAKNTPKMIDATRKYFEYGGERHCIREWAKIRGISYTGMRNRLRLYSPEVALNPDFKSIYRSEKSK